MDKEELRSIIKECMKEEMTPMSDKVNDIERGLFGDKNWDNRGLIAEVKELSDFRKTIIRKAYQAGGFMAAVVLIIKWAGGQLSEALRSLFHF